MQSILGKAACVIVLSFSMLLASAQSPAVCNIKQGCTGANNAAGALANLGGQPVSFTGTTDPPGQACTVSPAVNLGTYATSTTDKLYQCLAGTWTLVGGGGSGGGTVTSGSGYKIPAYGSAASTTVGPSNVTTDATGNNLNVPGTVAAGASITSPKFSMEPLSTIPASWTLDVTTPGKALASLGGSINVNCPLTDTILQCVALLPSTGGIINLLPGTYVSGYSELAPTVIITNPNVTLIGSGIPQIGATSLVYGTGTIIQGPILFGANNFTLRDLGVDVGPAVVASQFGGSPQDVIMTMPNGGCGTGNCQFQNVTVQNVAVIGYSQTALLHDVNLTGFNGIVVKNLHTQFNTHGLVTSGSQNVHVDGLYGAGHSGDCWIIKSGDAMTTGLNNVDGRDINCTYYGSPEPVYDSGNGIIFQAETGGNISNVTIDGVKCSGLYFSCIYTNPMATFSVNNVLISHLETSNGYATDVSLTSAGGTGGTTNWFELANSTFQNGAGGAIQVGSGVTNTRVHNIDINNESGSAGIVNQGTGSIFDNINYSSAPGGNRYILSGAGSSMWTSNLVSNVAGASSTFYIDNNNAVFGAGVAYNNGCEYTTETPVYSYVYCGPATNNTASTSCVTSGVAFNIAPYADTGLYVFEKYPSAGTAMFLADQAAVTSISNNIAGFTFTRAGTEYQATYTGTCPTTFTWNLLPSNPPF